VLLLGGAGTGLVSTAQLVALPTTLFLTVYLGCTASAARLFTGRLRVVAVLSCGAVGAVLVFAGWTLAAALLVAIAGAAGPRLSRRSQPSEPCVNPAAGNLTNSGLAHSGMSRRTLLSSVCTCAQVRSVAAGSWSGDQWDACPSARRLPSLSWKNAPRSPLPLLG
jgi:hypothetical protein